MDSIKRKLVDAIMPLYTFGVCGIAGILVDTDHLIKYLWCENCNPRFLHIPIFAVCGVMLCGAIAYIGGLVIQRLLKRWITSVR